MTLNTMGILLAGRTGCRPADSMSGNSDGGFPGGDLLYFKIRQGKGKCTQEKEFRYDLLRSERVLSFFYYQNG